MKIVNPTIDKTRRMLKDKYSGVLDPSFVNLLNNIKLTIETIALIDVKIPSLKFVLKV